MSQVLLEARNLSKAYGDHRLFSGLSFHLESGSSLGIIGRNGCGKTTLINILLGVIKADTGEVLRAFSRQELPYAVGVQMQDGYFEPNLRLEEVSHLFCDLYGLPHERGQALINEFGLQHALKTPLGKLSGGEKQKVNIILAILHRPSLLFFDEITTGLDAASRQQIYHYLKALRDEGKSLILVSHYFEEIWKLCDSVLIFTPQAGVTLTRVQDLAGDAEQFQEKILSLIGGETNE